LKTKWLSFTLVAVTCLLTSLVNRHGSTRSICGWIGSAATAFASSAAGRRRGKDAHTRVFLEKQLGG